MPSCELKPDDKKALAKAVGDDLLKHHGKKRYYTVEQIKQANQRQQIPFDAHCWTYALFAAPVDFADYHESIGETCDYASMHSEMLTSISDHAEAAGGFLDFSWLDLSDIDLSAVFDFFDAA